MHCSSAPEGTRSTPSSTRAVAEGSGGPADLPDTGHGLIAARLDLLPATEKALLQDAAVLGRTFWPEAIAAIADEEIGAIEILLRALGRKEFVRRDRRSSVAGDTEYAFAHALVRDVAYQQIPRVLRAEKHVRAAAWIEALPRRTALSSGPICSRITTRPQSSSVRQPGSIRPTWRSGHGSPRTKPARAPPRSTRTRAQSATTRPR
jgi:hypothetical protein